LSAVVSTIARRAFADSRVRNASFAAFFLLYAYVQVVGYRHAYPTLRDRLDFAKTFGGNTTLKLFYGLPHDLLSVGGYTAWRVGGTASIFAGVWGLLAAIRATRAEEDSGRQELVLAGAVSRAGAYVAALIAIGAGAALLWLALFLGLVVGRLATGASAYLALAIVSSAFVFAGVGALAAQLAPSRRLAVEIASGVLALAFLLRVVADTATGLGWVRWTTPLGWTEELRAFADTRPTVVVLPVLTGSALFVAAGLVAVGRDLGTGVLRGRDSSDPRLHLLSSPTALAFRDELWSILAWLVGVGAFAIVTGLLSTSFSASNIPENLREELEKLGASITTPAGALSTYFLLFVLAVSLFACAQVAAMRREEAEQRLETLFAGPVGRRRWLAGRLLVAGAAACGIALSAGVLAWVGAATQHAHVSLPRLLEAGANCLPTALLFLGIATLAFALVPRASVGVAYALVSLAFVWELVGALLGAPGWLVDLTPFEHVGLVPAEPLRVGAATLMLGIAGLSMVAAAWIFERRDLTGA
jgi:ABC-2 type transport system permease protein